MREVCDWTVTRKNESYLNGMKTLNLHHTSAGFILTVQPLNIFKYYRLQVCLWLHNCIYLLPHPRGRCFNSKTEDWVHLMTQTWKWFSIGFFLLW